MDPSRACEVETRVRNDISERPSSVKTVSLLLCCMLGCYGQQENFSSMYNYRKTTLEGKLLCLVSPFLAMYCVQLTCSPIFCK